VLLVPTKPKVVGNEAALPPAEVGRLLRAMPPATILVGGQALGFWLLRFGLLRTEGDDPAITRDADLIGSLDDAEQLAGALHGQLVVPHERARTGLVAQVRLPAAGTDRQYCIDILHQLYAVGGLRKSAEFTRRARNRASVVRISDLAQIRILHPLDVLASRVNNAAGLLAEKGEHVLTQARWAIAVTRHALLQIALRPTRDERPGNAAQEIHRLACSAAGRKLFFAHGIEVFDAVPVEELVRIDPGFEAQAAAMRRSIAARRNAPAA